MRSGNFVFIDVEASGLHRTSYPIEVAWCGLDLEPRSALLRPLPAWGLEDWSLESEKVHGISRPSLVAGGSDPREVAVEMAAALAGKWVFSDAPEYDARWLGRLFAETGVSPGFALRDLTEAWGECGAEAVPPRLTAEDILGAVEAANGHYSHTHRAGDECLRMAAGCRAVLDRKWLDGLPKRPSR